MLALAVLACALALRLFVPQGWMPVSDAHGFRLTLCSGMGPMEMASGDAMAAMPGMAHPEKGDHGGGLAGHPCGFGEIGLALADPLTPPTLLPPAPPAGAAPVARPRHVAIGRGLPAPPPPSTGPPALV